MVTNFYALATKDVLLKPTFDKFIDPELWPSHVERIVDFWSMVIFKNNDYLGQVFSKHIPMHLSAEQIDTWVEIFTKTVQDNFAGDNAEEAIERAKAMGLMFKAKIGMKHPLE